jgi:hypothetical protein
MVIQETGTRLKTVFGSHGIIYPSIHPSVCPSWMVVRWWVLVHSGPVLERNECSRLSTHNRSEIGRPKSRTTRWWPVRQTLFKVIFGSLWAHLLYRFYLPKEFQGRTLIKHWNPPARLPPFSSPSPYNKVCGCPSFGVFQSSKPQISCTI